jgi:hypothetical protein
MVYTLEEQDYGLHIKHLINVFFFKITRLLFTHLRNTTMFYTFEEYDYSLRI